MMYEEDGYLAESINKALSKKGNAIIEIVLY